MIFASMALVTSVSSGRRTRECKSLLNDLVMEIDRACDASIYCEKFSRVHETKWIREDLSEDKVVAPHIYGG